MKKICSLLLVATLAFSLAVPAFAEEEQFVLSGKYSFELFPDIEAGSLIRQFVNFSSNGENFVGFQINGQNNRVQYYTDNSTTYTYYRDMAWTADAYRTVEFVEPVSVSEEFYTWFMDNAMPWTCDGSTCPATDVNHDNVCDDCGMTFAVLRDYFPGGWPSNYPAPPTSYDSNSKYILMTKDDGYTYLYVFTPYDASPVSEWNTLGSPHNSMQLKMYDASGNGVNVKRLTYRLSDDGEWYQHDSQSVDSTLFGDFEEIDMIYSTLSFYKEDGTLFFPLPLWAEVEKVTQGEMMTALAETLGTMKILMVCGVGCLALLVVLSLFGKRSLISRG